MRPKDFLDCWHLDCDADGEWYCPECRVWMCRDHLRHPCYKALERAREGEYDVG